MNLSTPSHFLLTQMKAQELSSFPGNVAGAHDAFGSIFGLADFSYSSFLLIFVSYKLYTP